MRALALIIVVFITLSCSNSSNSSQKSSGDGIRIISLAPSITKELEELEMTGNIVGATSYCDITTDNKDLIIGDAINVNIEKVLLLKPDVILTTALTKQSTIDLFCDNGIKTHVVGKLDSFDDICRQFEELGKMIGQSEKALSVITDAKHKVDSLKNSMNINLPKQKIFIQIGVNPIFAVIPNTFMADYIEFSGCKNITEGFSTGTISRETILSRNPDVIIIATMGMMAVQEKKLWESFNDINAAKNGKIFIVDANVACVPTVKNFVIAFEGIVNLIEP